MTFDIISTGSKGNAVLINDSILIDCGVSFKKLKPVIADVKLILLTHIHSDHFNLTTLKRISEEKPLIRFACGKWLIEPLLRIGIAPNRIDVLEPNLQYGYQISGTYTVVSPVRLVHDVENVGYRIFSNSELLPPAKAASPSDVFPIPNEKLLYITDTATLGGITAKDYDLYLIEANYDNEEIEQRIAEKLKNGQYAYEIKNKHRHLSKEQADDFIYANAGPNSRYVYLHCHEGLLYNEE